MAQEDRAQAQAARNASELLRLENEELHVMAEAVLAAARERRAAREDDQR